jgi:elongation factor G
MSDPLRLIEVAIEPKNGADPEKLAAALAELVAGDPALWFTIDRETGQTMLAGISEDQLAEAIETLGQKHRIECNVGAPQVAYRETVTRAAEIDYTHKKLTGGSGQFARVKLRIEARERLSGERFASEVIGGNVPAEFIPAVEQGVMAVARSGVYAGFPLIDFAVTLFDGAYHDVDSSAMAFEIAARTAMRELVQKAEPQLLEPIVQVEAVVPSACGEAVAADLRNRRPKSVVAGERDDNAVIHALVPLANMFGYTSTLGHLSMRRGRYEMRFDHYALVPKWIGGDDRFPPAVGMRD